MNRRHFIKGLFGAALVAPVVASDIFKYPERVDAKPKRDVVSPSAKKAFSDSFIEQFNRAVMEEYEKRSVLSNFVRVG